MKKIVWMLVSCLMALSLVMASCGPAEEGEEEVEVGEEEVTVTEEEVEEEVVEEEEGLLPPEVPKYGGILMGFGSDPGGFDPLVTMSLLTPSINISHDELLTGDWAKGPAGTNETDWQLGFLGIIGLETGQVAESWELPDDETIIYHIRKGIHWENKYPANGREFTAEDAAWSLYSEWTTKGTNLDVFAPLDSRPISITATDKYTVELKVPSFAQGYLLLQCGERCYMRCRDVTEEYGDQTDWRNANTIGAFMLTDYVPASVLIYTRNPNYYGYDPLHPENQLPYLDGIKHLIISDLSSRLAAFRTGKIDQYQGITWEDAEILMKQCPELEYIAAYGMNEIPTGRLDKDLPFNDLRVRQALNLAVNKQELMDDYYEGHAQLLGWPFYDITAHKDFYTPLEELPTEPTLPDSSCSAQEIMTSYNPEKASKLLAEAGYPDGFKTKIICNSAQDTDFLSIIREYLLDVGVDMQINQLESGVFSSVNRGRTHEEMIYKETKMYSMPWQMHLMRKDSADDVSFYETANTRAVWDIINLNLGKNDAVWVKAVKDLMPEVMEDCWGIWMPVPQTYIMWWPWLQNFHGEVSIGYFTPTKHARYVWIDTEMKKSMGY